MQISRVTIFAGHYGSGKTNIALNYALMLKLTKQKIVVADLDIVNPYFRAYDSLELLNSKGIELISSKYANSNVDIPAVSASTQAVFDNKNIFAVVDLGGDDSGALALGRYAKLINHENDYEMLLVVNKYRPLTRDVSSLIEIKNEIENNAKVSFTGIVNNSNLGDMTALENVLDSLPFVEDLSNKINLPVKMTTVNQELLNSNCDKSSNIAFNNIDFFPIEIFKKTIWKI